MPERILYENAERQVIETFENPDAPGGWRSVRIIHKPGSPGDNEAKIREKVAAVLAQLEQADANWATLTVAQRTAAMQLAVRVSAKLARLALNRLEAE